MRPLVVNFSPRRETASPAPAAPAGPITQLKSAEVVSLSSRVETSCSPKPARGCQVTPRPADVCSDSWRVLCSERNVFRPARQDHDLSICLLRTGTGSSLAKEMQDGFRSGAQLLVRAGRC